MKINPFFAVRAGLGAVSSTKDSSAKIFLLLLAPAAVYLLLLPFVPQVQRFALERSQLRTKHFLLWAAVQAIPAMYSFENRFELSTPLLSDADKEVLQFKKFKNYFGPVCSSLEGRKIAGLRRHFPGGFFNSVWYRVPLLQRSSKELEVLLVSKYRSAEVKSKLRLEIEWSGDTCPPRRTQSTIIREALD